MTAERTTGFFQAGGTLRLDDPSYIHRPADDELFNNLRASEYCYVLTSRQRGKSSLMVRTVDRLRRAGLVAATVDLSAIGTQVTAEEWYCGIALRLATDTNVTFPVANWWRERAAIGPVQRLAEFLHDVLLERVSAPIVVFLDEIDTTLAVPFSDDFFAAIRQFYNLRASDPLYDRLTFVLLGVATPTDLIKDPSRTPFNIGRAVSLGEFRREDAGAIEQVLEEQFPGTGAAMLDRIFFWTNGHPYLTQRIGQAVFELPTNTSGARAIDELVQRLFFNEEARSENNLRYIRSSVEALPTDERRTLLQLYRRVLRGASVADDQRSPVQERLRLIGLVCAEDGTLTLRNAIYRTVFNDVWARSLTPLNWNRVVTAGSTVVIVLALLLAALLGWRYQSEQQRLARIAQLSQDCALQPATFPAKLLELDQPTQLGLFQLVDDDSVRELQGKLGRCAVPALPRVTDLGQRATLTEAICRAIREQNPYDPVLSDGTCMKATP